MDLEKAREILHRHSRSPKNGQFPKKFTHEWQLTNPICGDHVRLQLFVNEYKIQQIGFVTEGCAICSASTSLMCEEVQGKSLPQAQNLSSLFEDEILATKDHVWPQELENLKSFEHLRINPTRRVCALLPWVALRSALKEAQL